MAGPQVRLLGDNPKHLQQKAPEKSGAFSRLRGLYAVSSAHHVLRQDRGTRGNHQRAGVFRARAVGCLTEQGVVCFPAAYQAKCVECKELKAGKLYEAREGVPAVLARNTPTRASRTTPPPPLPPVGNISSCQPNKSRLSAPGISSGDSLPFHTTRPTACAFRIRFHQFLKCVFPFWSVGLMVQAQIQNPGTFDREAYARKVSP